MFVKYHQKHQVGLPRVKVFAAGKGKAWKWKEGEVKKFEKEDFKHMYKALESNSEELFLCDENGKELDQPETAGSADAKRDAAKKKAAKKKASKKVNPAAEL